MKGRHHLLYFEESFQEEIEESDTVEPNLKDIHNLLKNIQSAITAMQGNIAMLAILLC